MRVFVERIGYDPTSSGVETSDRTLFTLVVLQVVVSFNYLMDYIKPFQMGWNLTWKSSHNAEKDDNVSNVLLHMIGLNGKRVRKNASGDTQNLSFRNLCHLCLVTEGDIQKQGSPIQSGNLVSKIPRIRHFQGFINIVR